MFCLFDILPSERWTETVLHRGRHEKTIKSSRIACYYILYYVRWGMKLKVNRYCIFYTMGTIKYGLIKYKRVFVLCYNCLIDFKWVKVIYALCTMRIRTHRYYNAAFVLLFLRWVLFIYFGYFVNISRR